MLFKSAEKQRDFLNHYWQQKPLFIKNALSVKAFILTKEETISLGQNDEVESRLVMKQPGWRAEYGPFDQDIPWLMTEYKGTFLARYADEQFEKVKDLWQSFNFIPIWRRDDIMINYSFRGGTVGPHYDLYDVFLVQVQGEKRWQISYAPSENFKIVSYPDINIIADFQAEEEYLAQPGDVLYLPPGVAHFGVAENEGLTYSVGMRSPSKSDLLFSLAEDEVISTLPLFKESKAVKGPPSRIELSHLEEMRKFALDLPELTAYRAFCRHLSEKKSSHTLISSNRLTRLEGLLTKNTELHIIYFVKGSELYLFIENLETVLPSNDIKFIDLLSKNTEIELRPGAVSDETMLILNTLINEGLLTCRTTK